MRSNAMRPEVKKTIGSKREDSARGEVEFLVAPSEAKSVPWIQLVAQLNFLLDLT